MGYGEALLRIIGAIAALALVLFLAWLMMRWLGRRMPGLSTGQSRLIKVLDKTSFGRNSGLLLVRVHDKVLLIGFTDHATTTLGEFDDPEGKIAKVEDVAQPSFTEALKGAAEQLGFKRDKNGQDGGEDP